MNRAAIFSSLVFWVLMIVCQTALSQEAENAASPLDAALEKLTSKRAAAEVTRYRKALEKLEVDTRKEQKRIRKDLMDELDIALRMATKDKDYAEVQSLLDARLLLEKAADSDADAESDPEEDQQIEAADDPDALNDDDNKNQRRRVPRRSKRGEPRGDMDIPLNSNMPAGAKTFRKNKYLVIADQATWHHAMAVCENLGGHLVRVDDAEEQAFLEKLATAAGSKGKSHWIDASDEAEESNWQNSLGERLPYTNWDNGQPNNDNRIQHNAAMRRDLGWKWNDDVSSMRARFICEWEHDAELVIPPKTTRGQISSEDLKNAKTFRDNKYLVLPESATWHHALRICKQRGGHLVRVDDAEEQAFLQKLASKVKASKPSFWIDATDEEVESEWQNSLGQSLPYTNWDSGQPNNGDQAQHYANLRRDLDGKWNDDIPSKRRRFICEWEGSAIGK